MDNLSVEKLEVGGGFVSPKENINECRNWLSESVFPLWTKKGIDPVNGSFVESLTFEGEPQAVPRRAMVQARQIYSFSEAMKMGLINESDGRRILERGLDFLLSKYSLPSGAFIQTVLPDGKAENKESELYTQAFALFGMAYAYEVSGQNLIKDRAKKLLNYLNQERRAPRGGYTEIKGGKVLYQSNPHMHLFEAAIAWLKVDTDPVWKNLATDVFDLCRTQFIDKKVGVICEYFDETWQPLRENGLFIFEPGHQFEWAWLMLQYENLTGISVGSIPTQLYDNAEKYGINSHGEAVDEVWSNFEIKKSSSRFWPQSERIKAALSVGLHSKDKAHYAVSADQALSVLMNYLKTPVRGLWYDTLLESRQFSQTPAKASSLYHIINAMSEYSNKRLVLKF